ncbi:MAG: hypothetical protein M1833_003697 [Piccolia ochrophora]|nr:MAG: hypothetical protein M1833_003697 [Piccolia ochrophora]
MKNSSSRTPFRWCCYALSLLVSFQTAQAYKLLDSFVPPVGQLHNPLLDDASNYRASGLKLLNMADDDGTYRFSLLCGTTDKEGGLPSDLADVTVDGRIPTWQEVNSNVQLGAQASWNESAAKGDVSTFLDNWDARVVLPVQYKSENISLLQIVQSNYVEPSCDNTTYSLSPFPEWSSLPSNEILFECDAQTKQGGEEKPIALAGGKMWNPSEPCWVFGAWIEQRRSLLPQE